MTWTIHTGDARSVLATLPEESVDCCVTSPPYYGIREYGVEGQIGLEPSIDDWVARLVTTFREVRRVLKKRGTFWLNVGDSYAGHGGGTGGVHRGLARERAGGHSTRRLGAGLKGKDLIGAPWELALALRRDGWWLRSEIIWSKVTCIPESVGDRPTRSHEQVFLLTKSARYDYDAEAIAEPVENAGAISFDEALALVSIGPKQPRGKRRRPKPHGPKPLRTTRNARTVWTIGAEPLKEDHFAAFPTELARRCIAAGCPPGGTVLDPFCGAGTTGLVAGKLNRSFVGIELNPRYVELALKRCCGPLFAAVEGTNG